MAYDIANPDPAGTIMSLRSLGYSIEAAVADLVDNSIAADAGTVDVIFSWDGSGSWMAVVDDGAGMTPEALVTAMTVAARGHATARKANDLGRFGIGLKSASFSQCSRLTVGSRPADGECSVRTWDLGVVTAVGEWRLLHGSDGTTDELIQGFLPADRHGTAVIWRDLHRFGKGVQVEDENTQKQFYGEANRVEAHLGMVFSRFLSGRSGVRLSVNGRRVDPWDPFLTRHASVQRLPAEQLPLPGGLSVRIEPFILPQARHLSPDEHAAAGGPDGWLDQQGFYIYRRDRLIVAGSWLGIRGFRRDESFNLVRIAVEIPAEADSDWAIDVRKAAAVPPVGVRRHLQRIGAAARQRSVELLTRRGRVSARRHSADFVYAWRLDRSDERIRLRVNREHPLVREVLHRSGDLARDFRALIRLLEETVPLTALRVMHDTEAAEEPEPFLGAAPRDVEAVAERIFEALLTQVGDAGLARQRLALMPPFDEFDGFWRQS